MFKLLKDDWLTQHGDKGNATEEIYTTEGMTDDKWNSPLFIEETIGKLIVKIIFVFPWSLFFFQIQN